MTTMMQILGEITDERIAQDEKWGVQNLPNHRADYPIAKARLMAEISKMNCDLRMKAGILGWSDILAEEFAEAVAETDPKLIREELVQVAAVCVAWIECIDRRAFDA